MNLDLRYSTVCFLLFIAFFSRTSLLGQGIQGITPPTPAAYEMTSFEAQQPNLYTGLSGLGIPLYSFDFEGMKIPLSLSYNSKGIMVNQEATEVGLGWSLNATAVISRTVEGIDDLYNGVGSIGYPYQLNPIQDFQLNSSYWDIVKNGRVDTQPDVFNYNFFGYSGKFVFKKKTTQGESLTIEKLTLDDTKIEFNESLSNFTITTPEGFQGLFSARERTTTVSGTAGVGLTQWKNVSTYNDLTGLQTSGRYRVITSWYLTSITAPNGKLLNFEYDLETSGQSKYVSITQPTFGNGRWETDWIPVGGTAAQLYLSYTYYDDNNQANIQDYVETVANTGGPHYVSQQRSYFPVYRVIQEHVYLSKIEIPNELRITFNMEERHDLESNDLAPLTVTGDSDYIMSTSSAWAPQRYTGIQIEGLDPASTFSKDITFHQSYFHQEYLNENVEDDMELQYMRSRLDKLTIDDQVYRFEYNYGFNGLPNKSNFGIDNFGYFLRDIPSNRSEVMNRFGYTVHGPGTLSSTPWEVTHYQTVNMQASLENSQIGTLKRVYYPTGGYNQYEYELNEYYVRGAIDKKGTEAVDDSGAAGNVTGGGLRVKSISSYSELNALAFKRTYQYQLADNSTSSGILMSPLWNYFYMRFSPTGSNYYVGVVPSSEILAANSADGSNIGYSRVVETFVGNGESYSTIYSFENEETVFEPNLESTNRIKQVKTFKNGQLNFMDARNASSSSVMQETFDYYNTVTSEVKGMKIHFGSPTATGGYMASWHPYTLPKTFTGIQQKIEVIKNSNADVTQTTDYTYNSLYQLKEQSLLDSNGDLIKTRFTRPNDIASPSTDINEMISRNIVSPVIEVIQERNGEVISAQANEFIEDGHGNIVLNKDYSYDISDGTHTPTTDGSTFDAGYVLLNEYTKYDSETNLLEVKDRAGVYSALIWGHNKMLPIVKGEGITYDQLSAAYTTSLGANYEANIRSHANTQTAFVTTYDYDPYVGLIAQHDPNNLKISYSYTNEDRLQLVRDNDDNIVQFINYNFEEGIYKQLSLGSSQLSYGNVAPSGNKTQLYRIKNTGNDVMNISDVSFTNAKFTTSVSNFPIAPGGYFDLPITFTAGSTTSSESVTVSLRENVLGNPDLTFSLSAEVDTPQRDMILPSTCALVEYPFIETTVSVQNLGNDYLEVAYVEIDDNDVDDGIELIFTSTGEWRTGLSRNYELAMYIPPNTTQTFKVRYVGSTDINNWDGNTKLDFFTNSTNGFENTSDATIYVKKTCN